MSAVTERERAKRIVAICDRLATEDGVPSDVLEPIYAYADTLVKDSARRSLGALGEALVKRGAIRL
jgi:hypothetical protein